MFGSFNRATKAVGIIYYIFGIEVMVKGATRSSESGMLYLGKSITNRIIFRRFLNIFLTFPNYLDESTLISRGLRSIFSTFFHFSMKAV